MSTEANAIFATFVARTINDNSIDDSGPVSARGGRDISGRGWLYAIAQAMGRLADQKADQLEKAIDSLPDDAKPSEMMAIQADTQEFSLMMNTFTNAIKTLGEGNTAAGRKSGG